MKITVTQRIEIDGHVEEYSASADVEPSIGNWLPPHPTMKVRTNDEIARETAIELFKSLP